MDVPRQCERTLTDVGSGRAGVGEDFLVDGDDVAALLGDGAHPVGHSHGRLMIAATARPEAVRSLVPAEPPFFGAAPENPDVVALRERTKNVFARPGSDQEFADTFLRAVDASAEDLPRELVADRVARAPAVRLGGLPWGDAGAGRATGRGAFPDPRGLRQPPPGLHRHV